jgi:hypothetical protein
MRRTRPEAQEKSGVSIHDALLVFGATKVYLFNNHNYLIESACWFIVLHPRPDSMANKT